MTPMTGCSTRFGRTRARTLGAVSLAVVLVAPVAAADLPAGKEPAALPGGMREAVIDWIASELEAGYVFPEVAQSAGDTLRQRLRDGAYDQVAGLGELATLLTGELMEVTGDRHFGLRYSPVTTLAVPASDPAAERARFEERARSWSYENYYFRKVERLDGNVGYLRFDRFNDARFAGDTAVAALNFLATADALIVDLRENGGGSANMITLLLSYFFDEETHVNSWHSRRDDAWRQSWTSAYVAGPKLAEADLYVLTSGRTFSAAEEFAYDLQSLGRATLVGETTGGGGHTVEVVRNDDLGLELRVPSGRAVNPVTGRNWEGVGVNPDVAVPADQAFDKAYALALRRLHDKADPAGTRSRWLRWIMEYQEVRASTDRAPIDNAGSYEGVYGPVQVSVKEGQLFIRQPGSRELDSLYAVDRDTFVIDETPRIRIRFERDGQGTIVAVSGLFPDGSADRFPRAG